MAIPPIDLSDFLQQQLTEWELANANFKALCEVKTKQIEGDVIPLYVQFNPARIVSSGAKTDAKSIEQRPCFLCAKNRPAEQRVYSYRNKYDILVNPFPIFPQHFTVPHKEHIPQQILPFFQDMLDLAHAFSSYLVFYNGPSCGASAPDHMHFQLGNKGFLPIETHYHQLPKKPIAEFLYQQLSVIDTDFYHAIVIESADKKEAEQRFRFLYKQIQQGNKEPMLNVLCWYTAGKYVVVVIPRAVHRPTQFFAQGEDAILLSPASVDLGGVLITPLEKDFQKLTLHDVADISSQVCLSQDLIRKLLQNPFVKVGILSAPSVVFSLETTFLCSVSTELLKGDFTVSCVEGKIVFNNTEYDEIYIEPQNYAAATFEVHDVVIGVGFHWERKENQRFKGAIHLLIEDGSVVLINEVQVEDYLHSVISSEMSATSSLELLKAHAVISRSWLLAQMEYSDSESAECVTDKGPATNTILKWYDHSNHSLFDVCADDHCQRYQGVIRATTPTVQQAVRETKGEVLLYNNQLCDARFSKCCGGISERFSTCWENRDEPYLQAVSDTASQNLISDVSDEKLAKEWILSSPDDVFCNTKDTAVLSQILNTYDQETPNFFRWKVVYAPQELADLLRQRSGIDFGMIQDIRALKRGASGRIEKLEIVGSLRTVKVGKELEIRKWFSTSHLYSSAFVVEKDKQGNFTFTGAGWGHGVGLCQIGAAVMSQKGYTYEQILQHYYTGVSIVALY